VPALTLPYFFFLLTIVDEWVRLGTPCSFSVFFGESSEKTINPGSSLFTICREGNSRFGLYKQETRKPGEGGVAGWVGWLLAGLAGLDGLAGLAPGWLLGALIHLHTHAPNCLLGHAHAYTFRFSTPTKSQPHVGHDRRAKKGPIRDVYISTVRRVNLDDLLPGHRQICKEQAERPKAGQIHPPCRP